MRSEYFNRRSYCVGNYFRLDPGIFVNVYGYDGFDEDEIVKNAYMGAPTDFSGEIIRGMFSKYFMRKSGENLHQFRSLPAHRRVIDLNQSWFNIQRHGGNFVYPRRLLTLKGVGMSGVNTDYKNYRSMFWAPAGFIGVDDALKEREFQLKLEKVGLPVVGVLGIIEMDKAELADQIKKIWGPSWLSFNILENLFSIEGNPALLFRHVATNARIGVISGSTLVNETLIAKDEFYRLFCDWKKYDKQSFMNFVGSYVRKEVRVKMRKEDTGLLYKAYIESMRRVVTREKVSGCKEYMQLPKDTDMFLGVCDAESIGDYDVNRSWDMFVKRFSRLPTLFYQDLYDEKDEH